MKLSRKIITTIVVGIIVFCIINYSSVYEAMASLTRDQLMENKFGANDVRILAYKYYLFNYNDNIGQYIIGNGFYHSESNWGKHIYGIIMLYGYVLADIGVAKLLFESGIIGLIALGILYYKVISFKHDNAHRFIRYYVLYIIAGSVFSHSYDSSFLSLSLCIYLTLLEQRTRRRRNVG